MNYRKGALAMSLLVAALGVVVWDMRGQRERRVDTAVRSDYRLERFRMSAYGEDGSIAFGLSSPLLERAADGKTLDIETPAFVFPAEGGRSWQAGAERAWVSDRAREIQLRGDVRIVGPVSKRGLRTEFSADRLSVFPKDDRIASPGWVTVSHGTSILKGKGLEADMKQRRVKLLSEVTARYAPESR